MTCRSPASRPTRPRLVVLAAASLATNIVFFPAAILADPPAPKNAAATRQPAPSSGKSTPAPAGDVKKGRATATTTRAADTKPEMTMDAFLDRLMLAESGGNDNAHNPLSTATGPFQFIASTFLSVMRRHFPKRVADLGVAEILALRTNRKVARAAARAYTRDNATYLVAARHKPTFPHLRLAYLLGARGAIRILDARPEARIPQLVSQAVLRANRWMARHTARSLIARAARDVSLSPRSLAGAKPFRDPVTSKLIMPGGRVARGPRIRVRCKLSLASCRRWLSLERRKLSRRKAGKRGRRRFGARRRR